MKGYFVASHFSCKRLVTFLQNYKLLRVSLKKSNYVRVRSTFFIFSPVDLCCPPVMVTVTVYENVTYKSTSLMKYIKINELSDCFYNVIWYALSYSNNIGISAHYRFLQGLPKLRKGQLPTCETLRLQSTSEVR